MTPFIGEIMMFGGNFAPRGWALCDGALLAISSNTALFSILGTTYGGDGRTTFKLPDLRGRIPMHAGNGPGLTPRQLGASFGTQTNNMNILQMASHSHTAVVGGQVRMPVSNGGVDSDSPADAYLTDQANDFYNGTPAANTFTGPLTNEITVANTNTGNNQPINNLAPTQCINYIIALVGTYPARS